MTIEAPNLTERDHLENSVVSRDKPGTACAKGDRIQPLIM